MKKLINILFSTIMLSILFVFDAIADTPKCSDIPAGSQSCICEDNILFSDVICEEGQYCDKMTTTNTDGTTTILYSCRPLTENTYQVDGMFQDYQVISSDSYLYRTSGDDCAPYKKYSKRERGQCFLCPVFAVMFNTVSEIGARAIKAFSSSVVKVVVVGFAVWLAIQILIFVSSFETRDLKDLTQSVIAQGFLVMLVVAILQTGVSNFFNTFIEPVYETGQKMARTVLNSSEKKLNESSTYTGDKDKYNIKSKEEGLPKSMGNSIIQTMIALEDHVSKFKAFGSAMHCQSWKEGWLIFPKWSLFITGIAIWIFSWVIIIAVPFLMIDSVFQLGVATALMPVAVGGFAFKSTRQYGKKVWETVLNSMFSFLFITIVVVILMGVLREAITVETIYAVTGKMPKYDEVKDIEQNAFDLIFEPGSQTYFNTFIKNFSWAHYGFIKLAFTFILAWAMMSMGKEFANEFASSISNTSIGSSIGTMAASTTKGMATKLGKPMLKAAGNKIMKGTSKLAQGVVKAPGRAWKLGRNALSKRKLQKLQNQGKKAEYVDWRGRTHTLEGGLEKISTTRVGRNGKVKNVEIMRSRDITMKTIKTTQMVDGKMQDVTKTNIKENSSRLNRLISEDGKVDLELREKMLKGLSGEERKQVEKAIHMKIAEKRFGSNLHNSKKAMKNAPEILSYDKEKKEMVTKIITAEGDIVLQRTRIRADGLMETEMLKADKKGNVTTLSTDGRHNRKSSARLSNINDLQNFEKLTGAQLEKDKHGNVSSFNKAFDSMLEKDKHGRVKKQTSYSYSKRMQKNIDRGMRPGDLGYGMLNKDEAELAYKFVLSEGNEFRKADMDINFNL